MTTEMNGMDKQSKINLAEQRMEKQALRKTDGAKGAKEAERGEEAGKIKEAAGVKAAGGTDRSHDEYISSEKSGEKPAGLYRIGQDENGNRKIFFDNPDNQEEKCVGSTDKVDREIQKLKEKKQQLEQQIRAASGDEEKRRELERKLAQVENELSRKDNDAYRKQHSTFH